jgi:hypothetical protein
VAGGAFIWNTTMTVHPEQYELFPELRDDAALARDFMAELADELHGAGVNLSGGEPNRIFCESRDLLIRLLHEQRHRRP